MSKNFRALGKKGNIYERFKTLSLSDYSSLEQARDTHIANNFLQLVESELLAFFSKAGVQNSRAVTELF